MLQSIREHTQGWIAGIIISIIILTFALWGIHSYFVGGTSNVVAVVNGVDITKEQLTVVYERLRRQMLVQYGSSNPNLSKDETTLKERALQSLIDVEVLKQASLDQGFLISNRQIDNYLESMPDFQVDGQFSVERFQEILSSTMMSTGEFLDVIKTSLQVDQPRLGIVLTSFALPEETSYTISLVNQEREFDYITMPLTYFLSQPISISTDKIKAYYDQHQADFMTPEQVNLEYVELSLKEVAAKIAPTEAMLKNFYNENINSYTHPMEWKLVSIEIPVTASASREEVAKIQRKAEEIAAAINDGADFSKYQREYPGTDLSKDWVALSQISSDLQKAVGDLTKAGDVSDLTRTSNGFAIVKAVEVKEPKVQSFDTVKDKVKEMYIRQHAEEKFAEMRDQLADMTYEHPNSLQVAAKNLGLEIKTTEFFAKDKAGKDISQVKKVRDTAFSNDVLNLQNNSDVIQLNPESVVVIRVKSHVASALLPLSSVSRQIEEKLKLQEAEVRAKTFAHDFMTKLQTGENPQTLAAAHHFVWNKTGYLGRYSTKVDSAILDTAFRLANPARNQDKTVYGMTRLPNGYAIVALKAVRDGAVDDEKQYAIFSEQVQNSEGLLEYELYKQSQSSNAKIKIEQ